MGNEDKLWFTGELINWARSLEAGTPDAEKITGMADCIEELISQLSAYRSGQGSWI